MNTKQIHIEFRQLWPVSSPIANYTTLYSICISRWHTTLTWLQSWFIPWTREQWTQQNCQDLGVMSHIAVKSRHVCVWCLTLQSSQDTCVWDVSVCCEVKTCVYGVSLCCQVKTCLTMQWTWGLVYPRSSLGHESSWVMQPMTIYICCYNLAKNEYIRKRDRSPQCLRLLLPSNVLLPTKFW